MCYTAKNGRHRKEPVYEKERVFGGNGAVGCQFGERLKKQQEKAKETNK